MVWTVFFLYKAMSVKSVAKNYILLKKAGPSDGKKAKVSPDGNVHSTAASRVTKIAFAIFRLCRRSLP